MLDKKETPDFTEETIFNNHLNRTESTRLVTFRSAAILIMKLKGSKAEEYRAHFAEISFKNILLVILNCTSKWRGMENARTPRRSCQEFTTG